MGALDKKRNYSTLREVTKPIKMGPAPNAEFFKEIKETVGNIKSAKKRNRQNIVRNARNKIVRTHLRNAVKSVIAAEKSGEGGEESLRKAHSILAKAATKGVIHRNTASRKASRLARRLHKASSSSS
ncbi:MAG: 30S ribosomal protein S20 [Nitrospinota bacterium]